MFGTTGSAAMPFLDHLDELRRRGIRAFIILLVFGMAGWYVADPIIQWLLLPLQQVPDKPQLIFLTPPRLFMVKFWVGMATGTVTVLPYLFWEIWAFFGPALFPRERRMAFGLIFPSLLLFVAGLAFAFYIAIPTGLNFLLQVGSLDIQAQLEIGEYLLFILRFALGFGIIFQLPIVAVVLTWAGMIGPGFMLRYWRHALILILIVAAILTPPDVVSQIIMSVPLIVLYFLSVGASAITRKLKGV